MKHDRPQHDRPTACVIAQQYFSSTFVSLCFHSRKEKQDELFRNLFQIVATFLKISEVRNYVNWRKEQCLHSEEKLAKCSFQLRRREVTTL
jgi:hypothetical protein